MLNTGWEGNLEPSNQQLLKSNTETDLLSHTEKQQQAILHPEGIEQSEQQDGSGIVDDYSQLYPSEEG